MVKPWSKAKRIKVAALASGVIFIVALLSGTLIYGLSRVFKITSSGSIKKQVINQAINDQQLTEAYLKALSTKGCINQALGYSLIFDKPIKMVDLTLESECSQFEISSSTRTVSKIMISRRKEAKEEVVRQITTSLLGVETNTLPHEEFEVTSIYGERHKTPYQAYVLARNQENTYLIEYFPADPAGLPAVKELSKNFSLLHK